jgi:hypothetical protein
VGLKLNRAHQLLVYADDVNILASNINTINKNTEAVTDTSKDVGLQANIEKTQYMFAVYSLKCRTKS